METQKHFTLDELSQLSGTPRRSIRWYIQQQLVDRPEGLNRGAYYLPRHLEQLLTIRKWQDAGLSLNRIRDIMGGNDGGILPPGMRRPGEIHVFSHILLARGVTLVVDPEEAELDTRTIQMLVRQICQICRTLQHGKMTRENTQEGDVTEKETDAGERTATDTGNPVDAETDGEDADRKDVCEEDTDETASVGQKTLKDRKRMKGTGNE